MALILKKESLPGYQTAKRIYDLIPGGGQVKKILVAATVGIAIVGAIAAGAIGIAALVAWVGGSLLGSTLLVAGVAASLPFFFNFLGRAIPVAYTFNWNTTDKEIDDAYQSRVKALYGQLGEVSGQAVGWTLCGILPGTVTFAFNPGVGRAIMSDLSEEAREEVWGSIAGCQQSAVAMLGNALMMNGFKSARRWLKRPDSPFYGFLKEHLGENFTKWGDEGRPSWSFSSAAEKRIETIKDPNWKNFTEEFVENLLESCSNALQNMGNLMRQHMAAYAAVRRQEAQARSSRMVVSLDFSRDSDDEETTPQPPST